MTESLPTTPVKFPPRVRPEDSIDVFINIFVMFYVTVFMLPLCIDVGLVTGWLTWSVRLGLVASTLLYLAASLAAMRHTVRTVEVSADGIRLDRLMRSPLTVRWRDVGSIAEVKRLDVVRGMLTSLITLGPYWAMSFTFVNYCCIRWRGGCCYFPAKDPAALMSELRHHWPVRFESAHSPTAAPAG